MEDVMTHILSSKLLNGLQLNLVVGIGQKIAAIIMVNIRPIDQYFT
jgi:hypothetical protein